MKTALTLALVTSLALVSLSASAEESIARYTHQRLIEEQQKATWYQLDLPISIQWQAAHADLRDLRVFNAEGESLPFALEQRTARLTRERRELGAAMYPLYANSEASAPAVPLDGSGLRIVRKADGSVEIDETFRSSHSPASRGKILRGWLIDVSALDFVPDRLRLKWDEKREGIFRFSIAASDDLVNWRNLEEGQIVQLGFDGQSIKQHEIRLSQGIGARYLRLVWQDPKQAFDAVGGVFLSGEVSGSEPLPLAWSGFLTGEAVPGRAREFVWQFPRSLPLERVSIEVDEANTLAPVILSGRAPVSRTSDRPRHRRHVRDILRGQHRSLGASESASSPWQILASGVVYRLPAGAGEQVEGAFELPGIPVSELRLQIDPRSGGLGEKSPPRIKVAVRELVLTFLARGSGPYRLAWGNADAHAAALPLATLIPSGADQARAVGQLGRASLTEEPLPIQTAPEYPVERKKPDEGGAGKTVLWVVLLAGVVLLGGMAFSVLRSSKKDDSSGP